MENHREILWTWLRSGRMAVRREHQGFWPPTPSVCITSDAPCHQPCHQIQWNSRHPPLGMTRYLYFLLSSLRALIDSFPEIPICLWSAVQDPIPILQHQNGHIVHSRESNAMVIPPPRRKCHLSSEWMFFWGWMLMIRGQSAAIWGGAAVVALLLYGNKIPVVKNDVLKKIPLVRDYFIKQDTIPDSDKPFWDGLEMDGRRLGIELQKCIMKRQTLDVYVCQIELIRIYKPVYRCTKPWTQVK